ncbi:MAG: hypothetical protein D6710_02010 [Nitrospirae bacterium]|nr:MAG: hypothetical protein D6710_02010 [Nitrospirota bacterium]
MAKREIRYINRFLYFVLKTREKGEIIYCSGVNVIPFLPITRGRHKAMNNPVIRGLQIVNLDIRDRALKRGARPITIQGDECSGLSPTTDVWYKEQILIKDAPEGFSEEILEYAVVNLLKKMDKAIMLNAQMPDRLLPAEELEAFLERLCLQYGGSSR